jgi:hypothetical protein
MQQLQRTENSRTLNCQPIGILSKITKAGNHERSSENSEIMISEFMISEPPAAGGTAAVPPKLRQRIGPADEINNDHQS